MCLDRMSVFDEHPLKTLIVKEKRTARCAMLFFQALPFTDGRAVKPTTCFEIALGVAMPLLRHVIIVSI